MHLSLNASTLRSISILDGGGFVDSLNLGWLDVQFMFLPVLDNFDNTSGKAPPAAEYGFTVKVRKLLPKARRACSSTAYEALIRSFRRRHSNDPRAQEVLQGPRAYPYPSTVADLG